LSRRAGCDVWLKLEALQPTGSFKLRGLGHACQAHLERGAARFVSSSGGNAGLAVAYAGRRLGVPVLVVVPESTAERARALIRAQGAELLVHGRSWQEANDRACSLLEARDAFLHPFDDPLLWAGHSTLVDEVVAQGPKPEAVVLAVGGGGLLCGVMEGLHRHDWADVPVVAVETAGADSFAQSLAAGRLVELPAITSLATSLGARRVAGQALAWARRHPVRSVVVSDRAAVRACLAFQDDHRLLVEPACGAALAAVYQGEAALQGFRSLLVVVCGGAGTTLDQLRAWVEPA
jgi:L-serine/L-threonine ammonia-lyase